MRRRTRIFRKPADATAAPPEAPQPHSPGPAVADPPRQHAAGPNRFVPNLVFRWPVKLAWFSVICIALLVAGGFLLNSVRVPTLESVLQNGQPEPLVDMTSPLASVHRRAVDLLRSIPKIGERPSERAVQPVPGAAQERDARPAAPGAPNNGTELMRARTLGGSQLWVSNPANQDAVAKLVDADTATPVRVVYIQAKNKACIRHIAPGLCHLVAEVGENWDAKHVAFQTGRHTLERTGPFSVIDMTAGRALSGQCIDVSAAEHSMHIKTLAIRVLPLAVILAAAGQAFAQPNFTGDWKMNPAKSNFASLPQPDKAESKNAIRGQPVTGSAR